MTGTGASQSASSFSNNSPVADLPLISSSYRTPSAMSWGSSATSRGSISTPVSPSGTSPRVQLVPHVHRLSYDAGLSEHEREVLDNTSFDAFDLSSQDFDFEDIFTYDRPQKKLVSVLEVSSPTRDPSWATYSFSHYPHAATRQKVVKHKNGIGGMYVKNKSDAQKR